MDGFWYDQYLQVNDKTYPAYWTVCQHVIIFLWVITGVKYNISTKKEW